MKKKLTIKHYILCVLMALCYNNIYAFNYSTYKEFNLSIQTHQDSALFKEYEKVRNIVVKGDYVLGLKECLSLYDKSKKAKNVKLEYLSAFLLGEVYRLTRKNKRSLSAYKESLSFIKSDRIKENTSRNFTDLQYARNLLRIGIVFQNMSLHDSAEIYYNRIIELKSLDDGMLTLKAASYGNLSGIYQKDTTIKEPFVKAAKFAKKSIEIHKKRNNEINQAYAINNLANIYLLKGDYKESENLYSEAIKLTVKDTSAAGDKLRSNLYYNLAWAQRKLKGYKAYDNLEIAYEIKDSLRDDELGLMLERIQGEYDVKNVRKEEELKRLKILIQKDKIRVISWSIGITSILIIIFLGFLLNRNKLRQKNLALELSKQELIQQQEIENVRTNSQIEILNAALEAKEVERKRISQELHDGVLGRLFGSRIGLGFLDIKTDNEVKEKYQFFLEELQNVEEEIRDVSHKLNRDFSDNKNGFVRFIESLLEEKSVIGNFKFELHNDSNILWENIDENIKINLYRITQEGLQNILKHSKATQVSLKFKKNKEYLNYQLKDNGVGFVFDEKKNGIGLKNIKSRVEKLKGEVAVTSEKGTLLDIKLLIA